MAEVLDPRGVRRAALASLHGKVRYCRAQVFPRAGAGHLGTLVRFMYARGGRLKRAPELEAACRWWPAFIAESRAREVDALDNVKPVVVFTDGACEYDGEPIVSAGGVLVVHGRPVSMFGLRLPEEVRRRWAHRRDQQVIGQAELFPVLVAMRVWGPWLKDRKVLYFIDNDAARHALVKGYSPVKASAATIHLVGLQELRLNTHSWFSRVPSASNIADAPSRLDFADLERAGVPRAAVKRQDPTITAHCSHRESRPLGAGNPCVARRTQERNIDV